MSPRGNPSDSVLLHAHRTSRSPCDRFLCCALAVFSYGNVNKKDHWYTIRASALSRGLPQLDEFFFFSAPLQEKASLSPRDRYAYTEKCTFPRRAIRPSAALESGLICTHYVTRARAGSHGTPSDEFTDTRVCVRVRISSQPCNSAPVACY